MAICHQPSNLFASIDMGTNSFKLLIIHFEPITSKFTTLHHQSAHVVLGRNSSPPSSLPLISPESQHRATEALTEFQTYLWSHNVTRIRVVGTSAIREAGNQGCFLQEVREKLGFDFHVNVLSGVEEARLVYLGVLQFFPFYDKNVLAFDIGGGSTELVIGDHGKVVYAESLRLGHVTLTQKFKEDDLVGMRSYIRDEIEASRLVRKVKDFGFEVAIGSSGTIRAIEKAIWCGYGFDEGKRLGFSEQGGRRRRKWWWFSREELRVLVERLCRGGENEEERAWRDEFFGRRSEFIVAGAVLLDVILELLGISEMRVSGYALGEGVVAEMISEAFPRCNLNSNVRWKSVVRLAMRFNGKDRMKNGAQCAAIAKVIFEGLRKYKKVVENQSTVEITLQDKDLEYLEAACMLHNIGLHYRKKGYHKRSFSIIMEDGQLDGYTTEEIELVAQLAKHHRKKFPTSEHTSLQGFSVERFRILCSILRISVILQQEKSLNIKEIKIYHTPEGVILALVEKDQQLLPGSRKSVAKDIERKIEKEAELFEVVFDQKLLVVAHAGCLESPTR